MLINLHSYMKKQLNKPNIGDTVSDFIASAARSWKFVIFHGLLIAVWIVLNTVSPYKWDPFPFQLLKLIITIEGFFTASMLLMSNARQSAKDRKVFYHDFLIDVIIKREVKTTKLLAQKNDKRLTDIEKKMEDNGRKGT